MNAKLQNILIGIITILLVVGGYFIFIQQKKLSDLQKVINLNSSPAQQKNKNELPNVVAPDDIKKRADESAIGSNFVNGQVEKIENGNLTLAVISSLNGKKTAEYSVKITPDTKIYKAELSKTNLEEINLSDLRPGDRVAATSNVPLAGKNEFKATSITLIIQPVKQ